MSVRMTRPGNEIVDAEVVANVRAAFRDEATAVTVSTRPPAVTN